MAPAHELLSESLQSALRRMDNGLRLRCQLPLEVPFELLLESPLEPLVSASRVYVVVRETSCKAATGRFGGG